MAAAWRTVRVFISSTFRDMHAERDHLVKVVFPALREQLQKHRIHLIDIDLRWGVTREQAENDQSLDLCLQQIDECRPFFIGILGERYGWVPTRYPADALKKFGWIQHQTGKSVTELEIFHGVLQDSEMQGRAFFYFRNPDILHEIPEDVRLNVYADTDPECIHKLKDLKQQIRSSEYPVMENYPARWDAKAYDRPSGSNGRLVDLDEFGQRVHDHLRQAIQDEYQLSEQPAAVAAADPLTEEQDFHERFMESRLRVYVGREQINDELLAFAHGNDRVPCLVTGPSGSGKSAALARFVQTIFQFQISDFKSQILLIPHFVGASPRSTNLRDMLRRFCHVLKAHFGFAEDVPEEVAKLSVTFREFVCKVPADARVLLVIDALNQLDETDRAQELYWLPTELPPQVKVIVSCISDSKVAGTLRVPSATKEPILEAFRHRKHCPVQLAALNDVEQRLIIRQVPSLSAKTLDDDQVRLLLSNQATANPLFLLVALEELRGFAPYERLNERMAAFPREGDTVTAIFTQVIERLEEEFDRETVRSLLTLLASARRGLSERELQELLASPNPQSATQNPQSSDLFPVLRQLRPYLLSRAGLIDFYHRNLFKAVREQYLARPIERRAGHIRLAEYFEAQEWFLESLEEHRARATSLRYPARPANVRKADELPWQQTLGEEWARLEVTLTSLEFVDSKCKAGLIHDLAADYDLAQRFWPGHSTESEEIAQWRSMLAAYARNMKDYTRAWRGAWDRHVRTPEDYPMPSTVQILLPKPPASAIAQDPQGIDQRDGMVSSSPEERIKVWANFGRHYGGALALGEEPPFQLAYNSSTSGPVEHAMSERLRNGEFPKQGWIRLMNRRPFSSQPSYVAVLDGHSTAVFAVALAADARRVISSAVNGEIRIWRLDSGECEQIIESRRWSKIAQSWRSDQVNRISLLDMAELVNIEVCPGGAFTGLATQWAPIIDRFNELKASNSGSASSPERLDRREALENPFGELVAISPNGVLGISSTIGSIDAQVQQIHVWNLHEGRYLRRIEGLDKAFLKRVIITPDAQFIISAGQDHTRYAGGDHSIDIWESESGRRLGSLRGHKGPVNAIAVSADGRMLISGAGGPEGPGWAPAPDNSLRVWDLARQVCVQVLEGHTGAVWDVAISVDGRLAASASQDGTVRVWNLVVPAALRQLPKHLGITTSIDTDRRGNVTVTGGLDGDVLVWNARTGELVSRLPNHDNVVGAVRVSSDAAVVATGCWGKRLRVWDSRGVLMWSADQHKRGILSVEVTKDGCRILSGGRDGAIHVFDSSTGKHTMTLSSGGPVTWLRTSPDGRFVVSCHDPFEWLEWDSDALPIGHDLLVRVWDLTDGAPMASLSGNIAAVAPNGEYVVVAQGGFGSFDLPISGVQAFNLRGTKLADFEGPKTVRSLAITPDSQHVIAGDNRGVIWVWDKRVPQTVHRLEGHSRGVAALAVSPDAHYLISGGDDQRVCLWKLPTQQLICPFDAGDRIRVLGEHSTDGRVAVGLNNGRVLFLRMEVPSRQPPIVTACRQWLFGDGTTPQRWNDNLTAQCPWCGRSVVIGENHLGTFVKCLCEEILSISQSVCDNSTSATGY